MKTLSLFLGVVILAFCAAGCASHAAVSTPIAGVAAGASVR